MVVAKHHLESGTQNYRAVLSINVNLILSVTLCGITGSSFIWFLTLKVVFRIQLVYCARVQLPRQLLSRANQWRENFHFLSVVLHAIMLCCKRACSDSCMLSRHLKTLKTIADIFRMWTHMQMVTKNCRHACSCMFS